jgi:hypothetical protein
LRKKKEKQIRAKQAERAAKQAAEGGSEPQQRDVWRGMGEDEPLYECAQVSRVTQQLPRAASCTPTAALSCGGRSI